MHNNYNINNNKYKLITKYVDGNNCNHHAT